jgi:hypothetical protein
MKMTREKHSGEINNSSVAINVNTDSSLRNVNRKTIIVAKRARAGSHSLRQPMHKCIYLLLRTQQSEHEARRRWQNDCAPDARGVKSNRPVLRFPRFFISFDNVSKQN